jgi:predicted PurR-regulated permease PerM
LACSWPSGSSWCRPWSSREALLADNAPKYLNDLLGNRFIQDFDSQYHVVTRLQAEFQKLISDGNFMSGVFGGVLGAGKALASGFFSFLTVLVLTLYFLSSLPKVKHAAYAMIPASRRDRVISLSEEIMRRSVATRSGRWPSRRSTRR